MSSHPEDLSWTRSTEPLTVVTDASVDYSDVSDEYLLDERDRQQRQLDELTLHSYHSDAVDHLRQSIEREVQRMTGELRRRARSRHPSSRGMADRLRPLRSLSWPPHAG